MTVNLQSIIDRYRPRLVKEHGAYLTSNQWSALNALKGCRTGQYGDITWACHACEHWQQTPRSCGHRLCNQCQHHSTQDWLERQQQKLLPVNYYMVTKKRRDWHKANQSYLFNGNALAKVFRAIFLRMLHDTGLTLPMLPKKWLTYCNGFFVCLSSLKQVRKQRPAYGVNNVKAPWNALRLTLNLARQGNLRT